MSSTIRRYRGLTCGFHATEVQSTTGRRQVKRERAVTRLSVDTDIESLHEPIVTIEELAARSDAGYCF
jgi:hypothetical protein